MIQGGNINLDIKRVEGYRNFCNKIWNSFKLVHSTLNKDFIYNAKALDNFESFDLVDKWILIKLSKCVNEVNSGIETYEFGNAV